MRASQWFSPTLKEIPNDAEIVSHQLMLRAGLIKKLGSGLYTWLPTGLKILQKVETIVREEMNKAGAVELLMPAIQPAELWRESSRWETFGGQLLTMKDGNGRDYCFGPTHEEVVTDLIRNTISSYKDLPLNLYQIQTKFRDEIRPRFGVMRAREFIMKDSYSFHLSEQSLQETYDKMYEAYCNIFSRLGLKYRAVLADTGAIGGSLSHEFQVLADSGEDLIIYSDSSDYAANIEKATSLASEKSTTFSSNEISLVATPNQKTITDIVNYLEVDIKDTVKTLIVEGTKDSYIALVIRGDDTLNEIKAENHPLVKSPLNLIAEDKLTELLDIPSGSIGPVNLDIPVIADNETLAMQSFICGANKIDFHYVNASWERDAKYTDSYDLRNVKEGDKSPDNKGTLKMLRGIEVGHIFMLGNKYSKSMNARVLNEQGRLNEMLMGCYGLGVSRVIAAAIEQNHDEDGIIWPESMAPFQLVIIPINGHSCETVKVTADTIYNGLKNQGYDILLDDRKQRAGILFADNELIGIAHRLVISNKNLENGLIEYKSRKDNETKLIPIDQLEKFIQSILN